MSRPTTCVPVFLVFSALATTVWGIGFELGQSKTELKLEYTVEVKEYASGQVTAVLTLENAGTLTPLTGVHFHIPKERSEETGRSQGVDLTVKLAPDQGETSAKYRIHLRREWAQRGEFQLQTRTLDGKQERRTWYYHCIPLQDVKWE